MNRPINRQFLVIDILNLIIICFLSLVICNFCQKVAENNLSVTKKVLKALQRTGFYIHQQTGSQFIKPNSKGER